MELSDIMLKESYEEVKEEIVPIYLDFLAQTDSIKDYDLLYIKKVTKVGSNILKQFPEKINGQAEKLYSYLIEGVEVAFEINNGDTNISKMGAHMLSHAAFVAQHLFRKTHKIEWLKESYANDLLSANISETIEPKHSELAYFHSAGTANKLYNLTENVKWLTFTYNSLRKSITFCSKDEYTYQNIAAEVCFKIYRATDDLSWLVKNYNHQIIAAKENPDEKAKANYFFSAGKSAYTLYSNTSSRKWARKCCSAYKKFLDISPVTAPESMFAEAEKRFVRFKNV